MKKIIILFLLISYIVKSQTISNHNLVINHGDITIYLDKDTSTFISKHTLKYSNFKRLGKWPRDNNWFEDKYKGKYKKYKYKKTGYDLGHLTPSHITTYDSLLNHHSFSMFNQAPQLSHFNKVTWKKLESDVELIISKYKTDVVIITGVIYQDKKTLPNSRIKIPTNFYKILVLSNGKILCWIGSNTDSTVKETNISEINTLLKSTGNNLFIK